jgi:hypothetical protein
MIQRISLYPIYGLANEADDQAFDLRLLPFGIIDDITIENVTPLFGADTWSWIAAHLGKHDNDELRQIRHAMVHRYITQHQYQANDEHRQSSSQKLSLLAALLRIIRPMRQNALLVQGFLEEDGRLHVDSLQHPIHLSDVPHVQRLFQLRVQDATVLRELAPTFLQAMQEEFWKFRMAVEFHEAGHFQGQYWKARYSLWASALEALYTSQDRDHSGSRVATERIKWFLGDGMPIYPAGDIPILFPQSNLTVSDVINDIYDLRNTIAHGDRIADVMFRRSPRRGIHGDLNVPDVCLEAISFIVRSTLLRIMKDGLFNRFATNAASEAYFGAVGLTNSEIQRRAARQTRP